MGDGDLRMTLYCESWFGMLTSAPGGSETFLEDLLGLLSPGTQGF